MTTTLIICCVLVFWIICAKAGLRLPEKYRHRKCKGRNWKREFPFATKQEIRNFLHLFAAAFAFNEGDKLKFQPNDKILEIYRSLYPNRWMPDALELETLAKDLEKKHGIVMEEFWNDELTLGEVFSRIRNHA